MGGCSDLSGTAVLLSTEKSVLRVGCVDMALSEKEEIRNNEFQTGTEMEVSGDARPRKSNAMA